MQDTGNPKNAIIEYYPLSQFASPGGELHCTPAAPQSTGTVLESVTMTFAGPAINGYRRNTYTPGNTLECDEPFVRVAPNPVTFPRPRQLAPT